MGSDDAVLSELRTIRGLLAAHLFTTLESKDASQQERIRLLTSAGLAPKEIGPLLGVTANSVSVALTRLRKGGSKKAADAN